ncbi:hypothetical protein SAMN05216215_1009184 [Saccharopolyspora shandongensis]|uniref:Uncharacterized protein n=1 Tax=Saccharopolyspora shandongensis TaxID=418495 RepID=A0A1H3ALT5_9PSEU|nr:hypothetical protein SAMN05216215_1009184 [Saccharopolyspora shandongensis]
MDIRSNIESGGGVGEAPRRRTCRLPTAGVDGFVVQRRYADVFFH